DDATGFQHNRQAEILRRVRHRTPINRRRWRLFGIVGNSQAAAEVEILQSDSVGFQFKNELAQTHESFFEGSHFGDLRPEMALHTDDINIRELLCASIKLSRFGKTDTEFVLLHARRNVGMRAGIDIRIRADGNAGAHAGVLGDVVNQLQLGTRFDVEKENPGIESVADFLWSFADAGEDDFVRRTAGFQDAKQFAAGNDVESGAPLRKSPQKVYVRIRFDGVTNQVRYGSESFVEHADVPLQGFLAVDIDGGANISGDLIERNLFAV